jgi:hypothetical protein
MKEKGNVIIGFFWVTLFSIPLWMSIFGWVMIIREFI